MIKDLIILLGLLFLSTNCASLRNPTELSSIPKSIVLPINLNETYNPANEITTFTADLAVYYAGFVGSGYCYETAIDKGECCNEQITYRGWERYKMQPQSSKLSLLLLKNIQDKYNYQILFSKEYKKVLLLFPGTRTEAQLYHEFFEYAITPFNNSPNAKIYYYFYEVYTYFQERFFSELKAFYEAYPEAKDYQTIFQGHSLGAAMAVVFADAAVEKDAIKKRAHSPVLITLGQPRVGNSAFVEEMQINIPIIFRIVHMGDPIADLPPQTIRCTAGTTDCPVTSYIFVHGEGLKMLNSANTEITECYQLNIGNYPDSNCHNDVSQYSTFEKHTHYFWNNQKITEMCPPKINSIPPSATINP